MILKSWAGEKFLDDILDQLIKEKCACEWQIISLIEKRQYSTTLNSILVKIMINLP